MPIEAMSSIFGRLAQLVWRHVSNFHGTFWVSLRETISILLMRVLTCNTSFFTSMQLLGATKHWKQR